MVWLKLKNPNLSISNAAGFNISGETIVEAPKNLRISPNVFYIYNTREEALGIVPKKIESEPKRKATINKKYADNLLSQNSRTILKSLGKDKPSPEDAKILLESELNGKRRSAIIRFLKNIKR